MAKTVDVGVGVPHVLIPSPEPRPFQRLKAIGAPRGLGADVAAGLPLLEMLVWDQVPAIVRSLVERTIALQHARAPKRSPLPLSVLNRRRRAARSWIVAVMAGRLDRGTLHALTTVWVPHLAGTGPEIEAAVPVGVDCVELLRGLFTAAILDRPADNLVPQAKALHAVETILGVHLQAIRAAGRWSRVEPALV